MTARYWYQRDLNISQELGNLRQLAITCNNIGCLDFEEGNYQQAFTLFTQALEYQEHDDISINLAATYNNLGRTFDVRLNYEAALQLYKQGIELLKGFDAFRLESVS